MQCNENIEIWRERKSKNFLNKTKRSKNFFPLSASQWPLLCFKAKTPDCDTRASIEFLAKLNVEMQPFDNLTLYYPLGWSMYVLCSMEYMAPSISCWWWSLIKYYSKSAHFWSKSGSTEGWFVFNENSFTLFLYKSNFCFVTPFSGAASTVESKFEGGWLKPRGRRAVNGGAASPRSHHCAAGDCLNPILSLSPTPEPSSPKHTASPSNTADPQMKTLVSSWGFAAPPNHSETEVENCSGQLSEDPNGCINLFTQPEPILNQEVLKWESFTFGERRTISLIHLPSREQRDISVPNATLNFRQAHRICGTNFRTFILMLLSYDIYF